MPKKNAKYLTETDVLSRLVNLIIWVYAYTNQVEFFGYFRAFFETPKLLKASRNFIIMSGK
jgi:hypothetical protein